jgi:hypothetical protein
MNKYKLQWNYWEFIQHKLQYSKTRNNTFIMCSQIEDQKLDWCNIFDLGIDLTMLGAQIFGKEASKTQVMYIYATVTYNL